MKPLSEHRIGARRFKQWLIAFRAVAFGCALVLAGNVSTVSADWPFERGDAQATGVVADPLPSNLQELWRFSTDGGSGIEATAVIGDGVVFVGDVDGTYYGIKLTDGELVWKKKFEQSGFLSAAAIADGKVYVGDFSGFIRCLDATRGDEIWKYEARGEVYAGPNVIADQVLVTTEAGELLSLHRENGDPQWKFEIDAPLRCWPLVVDGRVLLAGCDSRLHSIDVATGQEVEGVDLDGQTGATAAHWGDSVYFGTVEGTFYRIRGVEVVWQYRDEDRLQQIYSASVDLRAAIYSNKGKRVYALDPQTGKVKWEAPVRTGVETAVAIAGDTVYFGTKRGQLYGLEVSTGNEVWTYEAGGSFLAAPAVSDNKLVIGNADGTLYCFGAKD